VALRALARRRRNPPRRDARKGVTPQFDSGVDHFETDEDDRIVAAVDPNGERYDGDFAGVAIGLNFNTEFLRGSGIETDNGVIVDEYMRTNDEDVFAAGDITQFWDTILDERAQNGAWGSAKEQGSIAGTNMVADVDDDTEEEAFRWVSTYSITHFDFPFLSFGHPTLGDAEAEAKYGEREWRRLTFKDGKLIGGVLIGDLSQQSKFKEAHSRGTPDRRQRKELLTEQDVDMDKLLEDVPATAE